MAALAQDTQRSDRNTQDMAAQVVNGSVVFAGSFMAMVLRGHPTAALRGRTRPWTSAAFELPLGFAQKGVTGNTAASPIPESEIDISDTIEQNVLVTGASGISDQGRFVFRVDDGTFTLTRPLVGTPAGMIVRFITGTTCDVLRFGLATIAAISLAGSGQYTWHLGLVGGTGVTGNMLTGIVCPHHGFITSFYGIVCTKLTDLDVSISINLEIGGTNVTGGVVNWLFSDPIAAKKSGTAITALNEFHEGDLLNVEAVYNAAGTVSDPGLLDLYATVQTDVGL